MRVIYLVTVLPGVQCGVVDYTRQLAQAMTQQNASAIVEELSIWSFAKLWFLFKKYGRDKETVFHVQYPTLGMGKSFAPALLPLLFGHRRVFYTLHEFGQFNPIRKLYFLFAGLLTKNFIFTNEHEQRRFAKFFPWQKNLGHIIPIGNNINVFPLEKPAEPPQRLVYFGQIAPDKGIEQFLDTVRLLRAYGSKLSCAVIGALINPESEIAKKVKAAAADFGIDCLFNLSSEDVSKELQKSSIALLPFAEGVSDKRGSALACLKHGLAVLTKHTGLTPAWWRKTTHNVQNAEDAVRVVENILSEKTAKVPDLFALADALAEREWINIAKEHLDLYNCACFGLFWCVVHKE
ncbi:MAG: hypothetical protein WC464_08250 [Bdellovibrionales bacterium]